ITGTLQNEYFLIRGIGPDQLAVEVFGADETGNKEAAPYYFRIFNVSETKELRVYGIGGNDQFVLSGSFPKNIQLRLIGGPGRDSYRDESTITTGKKKILIYDDHNNEIKNIKPAGFRLSEND